MMRVSSVSDALALCICCDVCVISLWCSVAVCLLWCVCQEECDAVSLHMICYDACVISDALSLCRCFDVCVISLWCSVAIYLLWRVWPQSVMQCLCVWSALMCVSSECETVSLYVLWCVYHQFVVQCCCVFAVMCVTSECGMVSLHMIYFDVCIISLWCSVAMYFLRCVCHQSVVRCLWHPKLNQMALGCGDGRVHLYYDPKKSHRSVGSVIWLQQMQNEIFKYSTQEYWFYVQQSWATAVSEVWRWFADGGDLSVYYWRLKWCFIFCFVKLCLKLPNWSGTGMSKFQVQLFIMF